MNKIFLSITFLAFTVGLFAADEANYNYKPKDGYVPDEKTAIAIAVAVWSPIYGEEEIQKEKPFKATLKDGVWQVAGSLPDRTPGGVAIAEISKNDARILRVSHGK